MLHNIEEFEKSTPDGLLEWELREAVAASLERMSEQEIVETVLAEITRQRNLKRDDYYASKMDAGL